MTQSEFQNPNDQQTKAVSTEEFDPKYTEIISRLSVMSERLDRLTQSVQSPPWFSKATVEAFNKHVEEFFKNQGDGGGNLAKDVLLIKPDDSVLQQIDKKLSFMFIVGAIPQLSEGETSTQSRANKGLNDEDSRVEIKLRVAKKYNKNGNPIGTQTISIPHVDESKLNTLKDFNIFYGSVRCVYKFTSNKLIKINAKDKAEGVRVINKLLKIVKPEMFLGTAQKHGIFTDRPEDRESHELVGEKGKLFQVYVFDPTGERRSHSFP